MLNQLKPRKIITMNLTVFQGTELASLVKEGKFAEAGVKEKIREIKSLIENLDVEKRVEFDTTHATNPVSYTNLDVYKIQVPRYIGELIPKR